MNTLLAYIQFIFIGLLIYGSVITFSDYSMNVSLSGIVAPILAWFSGTGLRASFNGGNTNQKKSSVFIAIIILAICYVWINSTGYWYVVNKIEVSGKNLLVISFFVGFLSTIKPISQIQND